LSNLNEFLNAVAGKNEEGTAKAASTVAIIGSGIGVLADLSGAIGFIPLAISLIDMVTGNDKSLDDVLNAMTRLFAELNAEVRAGQILERMRDLANTMADSQAVLQQLPTMVKEQTSNDFRLEQIQKCLSAVINLTDVDDSGGKWKAVYGEQIYYSGDGWSYPMAPQPDVDDLVFNYTYILPLYLRSIYTLLTVIGTLTPKDLPLYSEAFRNCVVRLQRVHDTIVDGIVISRLPAAAELWKATDPNSVFEIYKGSPYAASFPNGQFLGFSGWAGGLGTADPYRVFGIAWPFQIFGAVEIYSGANSITSYPPLDVPPSGPPPDDAWIAAVQGKLALRALKARKDVYAAVGLQEIFRVANNLRSIAGDPTLPEPALGGWTVLEIYRTLGNLAWWGADWQHVPPNRLIPPTPTLLQLRKYLESVPPTQTGSDFAHLSAWAPTSLRQMLSA
jgi:hypothetical protein